MVNINILHETGSGRILSANLATISPIPAGHAIVVKDVSDITQLFAKRVDQPSLDLVDKDFIQLDSSKTIPISTVATAVFTKRNGETNELEDDAADNETILVSTRQPNFSFDPNGRKAFFDILSTALFEGAGQVKIASGLGIGKETLVLFNDTLRPAFEVLDYV